MDLSAERRMA